jgi:tetratricopeptide (TPR) repeat protein
MVDHSVAHEVEIIEEAISVYEQVLQLRPMGHERRAEAVGDLGDALFHFCADNQIDDTRARRGVELLREAVLLTPPRHLSRDRALHRLARTLLFVMYRQSGDLNALSECIDLYREALQLRKAGHPERDDSLSNLAVALKWSFERCGDPSLMEECIQLSREVLELRKPGNPRRDRALNNLATTLHLFVSLQGGMEMLAEADSLLREALELRPPGHPLRYGALDNLAGSLVTRHELEGLPAALSEAIALQREAIELLPTGHIYRCKVMNDLAGTLMSDFRLRRDSSSLTEGIALVRHVLALRPPGHPARDEALNTLATALVTQFNERRDSACLQEAIAVRREALALRPPGELWRVETLVKLGETLCEPECRSWPEALELFLEALKISPTGHHFHFWLLSGMSKCFLHPASPLFDLSTGISHLSEAYSNEVTHVNQRLGEAVSDLRYVEMGYAEAMRTADASTRDQYSTRILDLSTQVLCLLPRAAHFGLNHKARLQVITGSDEIARNAAARALFLGRTSQAVELLEEGRGIFWSQTLHLRATGFDGVPASDREDLLRLLRMLEHGASNTESSDQTVAQREEGLERRRIMNAQAQTLISRIRTYPGCTRFLLPATFETLLNGLPDGFVVIMNASNLGQHALLLHRVSGIATSLVLKSSSAKFDFATLRARLPRDSNNRLGHQNEPLIRAMRLDNGAVHSFEDLLCQMWTSMVQPVIRQLGLQVSRVSPRVDKA